LAVLTALASFALPSFPQHALPLASVAFTFFSAVAVQQAAPPQQSQPLAATPALAVASQLHRAHPERLVWRSPLRNPLGQSCILG
jgi:hypothetical protein